MWSLMENKPWPCFVTHETAQNIISFREPRNDASEPRNEAMKIR